MTATNDIPTPEGSVVEKKPPQVRPRIIAAPKIRQIYWCDFWQDAQLPEMWKTRPVVVVSYKNTLHGPCLVLPTTTQPQGNSPWAYEISSNLVDGQRSWVICNHPYTVAPSRFSQGRRRISQVSKEEFNEILSRLMAWIPRFYELDKNNEKD